MVPLSTRDTKQRDTLAMFTSTGTSMIPGMLVTVIMPLLVPLLGVGQEPRDVDGGNGRDLHSGASGGSHGILFHKRACHGGTAGSDRRRDGLLCSADEGLLFNRYWLLIMGMNVLTNLFNQLSNRSMVYYCNWVLGNSVDSGALHQIMVNVIGQAPMGFGVFLLWPLVRNSANGGSRWRDI